MAGVGRVFGGGQGLVGFKIPDWIGYNGEYVIHMKMYNGKPYVEYELRTSGTLLVAKSSNLDFYLVGPGGRGGPDGGTRTYDNSNGTSTRWPVPGFGGSAGYPLAVNDKTLLGSYPVVIGTGNTNTKVTIGSDYTANKGGNGTSTGPGAGFVGTYMAYGDASYPLGAASLPTGQSGASGLTSGRAAGGLGGTRVGVTGDTGIASGGEIVPIPISDGTPVPPTDGTPGVVLVRIRLR